MNERNFLVFFELQSPIYACNCALNVTDFFDWIIIMTTPHVHQVVIHNAN